MASAAIGAAGSVAGGIASGKGASKAAKIQAASQDKQTAALQAMYNTNKDLMMPTYDNGTAAQSRLQSLLGLSGGDGSDAQAVLAATPGYQFNLQQGLAATNAGAYASGLGNSGAALKSLQDRGASIASQTYNNYVGQLSTVADRGVTAMGGLVSQGNSTTQAVNSSTQAGADAASANAAFQGNNLANIIKGVASAGSQAMGSSYGSASPSNSGSGILSYSPAFSASGLNTQYFGGR